MAMYRLCCVLLLLSTGLDALLFPKGGLAPKAPIDLRSDTVTKPSAAMRKLMHESEVGDDVFREDPSINKLEARVATMFQKERSLFFPTGTMANLAASMACCNNRGAEAIIGDCSHMYLYEQANLAHIAGISPRVVPNQADGTMSVDHIETVIRSDNIHFPVTNLIALENTHNYCGGRVLPAGYTEAVCSLAKRYGIPVHIDGARIWNAATATSATVASLVAPADSITACLSKGLGAPAGSMLIGSKQLIDKARRIRKSLGGGMRQVGILAAAGLQALDDFEAGILMADHQKASRIAESLSEIPGLHVEPSAVETNIILVHLESDLDQPGAFAAKLKVAGVLVLPFGPRSVRIVTHRDIAAEDVDTIIWAFRDVAGKVWAASYAASNFSAPANDADVPVVKASAPAKDGTASETVAAVETADQQTAELLSPTQATTAPASTQAGSSSPAEAGEAAPQQYEQVTVRGMSVSNDGFCVILQGTSSLRCMRVLVTPEDPMSDGLDHDEVESSEAVTLLQLLQGIDVETYLPKDALEIKFSAGARSKQYDLKAVLLNGMGRGKEFQAILAGSAKASAAISDASSPLSACAPVTSDCMTIGPSTMMNGGATASSLSVNVEVGDATATPLTPNGDASTVSDLSISPLEVPSSSNTPAAAESSAISGSASRTMPGFGREVPIESAFYAIALALRHHVPIEVRADILQDDKKSFPEHELSAHYPKLLATATASMPVVPVQPVLVKESKRPSLESLKKRLAEAIRQRNEEKIAQIQETISAFVLSAEGGMVAPPESTSQQEQYSSAQ